MVHLGMSIHPKSEDQGLGEMDACPGLAVRKTAQHWGLSSVLMTVLLYLSPGSSVEGPVDIPLEEVVGAEVQLQLHLHPCFPCVTGD